MSVNKGGNQGRTMTLTVLASFTLMVVLAAGVLLSSLVIDPTSGARGAAGPQPTITPSPTPFFNPSTDAMLPDNRIIAFYGIPGAEAAGPAFTLTDAMVSKLKQQGDAYQTLDPSHPVVLGIDLVANLADGFPGPNGNYDHDINPDTVQQYIDFCQKNSLQLFLDLQFGRNPIKDTVNTYLPYLQKYAFVHLAIDPEWTFPSYNRGIPGIYVGSMNADDVNWIIEQVAAIPLQFHLPRKMLIIHEFRPEVLIHKEQIVSSALVSIVLHVDSVGSYGGGVTDKIREYNQFVHKEHIQYGGFKLFYNLESPYHLMTPKEVLALDPAPLVITYGN